MRKFPLLLKVVIETFPALKRVRKGVEKGWKVKQNERDGKEQFKK